MASIATRTLNSALWFLRICFNGVPCFLPKIAAPQADDFAGSVSPCHLYTRKHRSWVNVTEVELSQSSSQCLNGRSPYLDFLPRETAAWANNRNDRNTETTGRSRKTKTALNSKTFIR
jgi:hypothetical protein